MSDVVRARALLVAALAAALGTAAALFASNGAGSVLSPAPVSAPHQRAGLGCASCHEAESPARACVGCHGEQRSARAGHARLSARGELGCGDCHRAHGAEGVRADERGALLHFVGSDEWPPALAGASFAPGSALPLIARQRCSACHDLERPGDPAAHCFSVTGAKSLCFDEHIRTPAGHAALAEAARGVAQSDAASGRSPSLARTAWQLGMAFGLGLIALVFVRRRGRRPLGDAAAEPPSAPRKRLPVIDAARCLGCGACVEACPHDVLQVSRHVALVARPDACCGLALCAERCPNGSLSLSEGELVTDAPSLSDELESLSEPGVFLAGDVTGQSLIRTAMKQGARAAQAVRRSLAREPRARDGSVHDLVIVGAGPAGLSAALEAQKLGLRAVVLEQGRVAESIQSFSRDKIVLDAGVVAEDLPLWVGECHKDELVRRWLRAVHGARLDLREQTRVDSWCKRADGGCFELRLAGDTAAPLLARRVLLAFGRRGSPRKLELPIPAGAESRVHYSLSDARSFGGQRVVIVGLGDSAMEAAAALAQQSGTSVDVIHRASEHRRGKRRNIAEFRRLCDAGRVRVHWSTEVAALTAEEVVLRSDASEHALGYDALFVLIGGARNDDLLPRAHARG
jgi:thioredoxin reductase